MQTKVITRVLGLTYAPCMDTYTNKQPHLNGLTPANPQAEVLG